ncbi:MAG: hypothetical protein ACO3ZW_07435 [Opitutales bacterium]
MLKTIRTKLGILCLLPLSAFAGTGQLSPGLFFPELTAQDQHEEAISISPGVRHVVVTFSMGEGKKTNAYFAGKGAGFLAAKNAVLINDIHPMPGVGRMFALPKMRKYPHRIFLADEEGLLDPFPRQVGLVTVFDLDEELRILAIRFWDPASGSDPFQTGE